MSPRRPSTPTPAGSYESHFEHSALFEFSKVINSSLDPHFILSHILLTIMGKILSTKGMVMLGKGKGRFSVEMAKGFPGSLVGTELAIRAIPGSLFYVDKVDASRHPWVKFFRNQGVRILLTDRETFRAVRTGLEIAATLHRLYPGTFELEKVQRLLGNRAAMEWLRRGDGRAAAGVDGEALEAFLRVRERYLLY